MTIVDLLISIGSAGLVVFTLPTVLNKNSQVPRKAASIPTALILTYFVPLFATSGLVLTSLTIAGQAIVWWLIVALRPVRTQKLNSGDVVPVTPSPSSAQKLP
ncbi:MAG TPA: hypothetical protein VFV92_02470 [Candidatus Bathyarchaeia archaeon]|nr:hypothetical protein [Candidatus Bathyarchaeia archaeon]